MKVTARGDVVTVEMTTDELGIIRYAMDCGAEKLDTTAHFLKSMKSESASSALETATRAGAANDALEAAVQEWVRTPTETGDTR